MTGGLHRAAVLRLAKWLINDIDQGDTIEEALNNLKEALKLYYDDNKIQKPENEVLLTTSLEVCV